MQVVDVCHAVGGDEQDAFLEYVEGGVALVLMVLLCLLASIR